ncbi:hypothetical protein ACFQJ7_15615 [Halovenus rubra]|uniref:Uncharacterized protein n=2 Tax=Halovenus rubra TaxID=869890 RepID=A0ACC7E164_9EURY|nr:hypothetical protein [Halovenus rubra]
MDSFRQQREPTSQPDPQDEENSVSVHQSSPDRTVFTEDGNTDGWIATDLTVSLER